MPSIQTKQQKQQRIYQAVDKLDDLQLDQISAIISGNGKKLKSPAKGQGSLGSDMDLAEIENFQVDLAAEKQGEI